MKKALLRCADELPDTKGLTRSQRQILQLVAAKKSSFREIFTGLNVYCSAIVISERQIGNVEYEL